METRTELYSAGSIIAKAGEQADRLMVLVSGTVSPPNIPPAAHPIGWGLSGNSLETLGFH
jgi:hypothetical protein